MKNRYDVIVAGSGPAGFAAAYYAATHGADVLLVEKGGTLGGMLTTGLMGIFCGWASSGLFETIREELCRTSDKGGRRRTIYDIEEMKQFLYAKADECGMSLLLQAPVTGVQKDGASIRCLDVQAKEGHLQLAADLFIDATGDGDVAVFAGEAFTLGREEDGKFQPMSLMVELGGVETDTCAVLHGGKDELVEKLRQYVDRGEVPYPVGHVIVIPGFREGTVKINMTNVIDLDGTRSEDLTRAEIACRKQLADIVHFLRKEAHGFENCYVSTTAGVVGVRETRHIRGKYVLNERDISQGRVFDDWAVSHARYGWGTHNLYGPIHGNGQAESKKSRYGNLPTDKPYTIPYRSLLPARTDNLLLAGRCISGTFLAHSNYRVMPICMAMGQAAGTAAALCAETGSKLEAVDLARLHEALIADGVEPPAEE